MAFLWRLIRGLLHGCRYQYDPNGRVRDAMAHIWTALVPEPRAALDAHFGTFLSEPHYATCVCVITRGHNSTSEN